MGMKLTRTVTYCVAIIAIATGHLCMAATPTTDDTDAFLWLEDVEGDRALDWVRDHN